MNVKNFLNIIPKPSNSDVIVYIPELKELLDRNVFNDYKENYELYNNNYRKIKDLNFSLKQYQDMIDSAFLYNKSWNEADYINMLQKDKKTYSIIYNNIKKIEDKILVLQQKINSLDEAIELQKTKDSKEIEKKKDNLNEEIETKKNTIMNLKEQITLFKTELLYINKNIEDWINEKTKLEISIANIYGNDYCCEICGTKIESKRHKNKIAKTYSTNIENLSNILLTYKKRQIELETKIQDLVSQQKEITISLNNDLQFKEQDYNIYQKKSTNVLKLEALRNKTIKDISEQEKLLKTQPGVNSNDYKELKDRIDKFELSLSNLRKLKVLKQEHKDLINELNKLQNDNKELESKIIKELNFISIYYKICQQKINNYIGENITFILFKIENYKLIEELQIFYKGIEYEKLETQDKNFVDKIIAKYIYKDL